VEVCDSSFGLMGVWRLVYEWCVDVESVCDDGLITASLALFFSLLLSPVVVVVVVVVVTRLTFSCIACTWRWRRTFGIP